MKDRARNLTKLHVCGEDLMVARTDHTLKEAREQDIKDELLPSSIKESH